MSFVTGQAVNKLDALVKERQLGTHELLSRAKSCEVVFDAAKLKSMKEESEREFTKMRESMEVSALHMQLLSVLPLHSSPSLRTKYLSSFLFI